MDTRPRTNPSSTLAFHASRIVIDVGVLLVLGAMSLTFVTAPGGNRSAMDLDALPALLLVAPIFAVTMIPDHARPLPRPVALGALLLGLLAFPYSLLKYLDAVVLAKTLAGSLGLGVRLFVFGNFLVVVGIAIGLARAWMGLSSSGSPTRIATAPRRAGEVRRGPSPTPVPNPRPEAPQPTALGPRPARDGTEESPFGEPLFDSLEIPASESTPGPLRQPGLVFDAGGAADRHAEEAPEDPAARRPQSGE